MVKIRPDANLPWKQMYVFPHVFLQWILKFHHSLPLLLLPSVPADDTIEDFLSPTAGMVALRPADGGAELFLGAGGETFGVVETTCTDNLLLQPLEPLDETDIIVNQMQNSIPKCLWHNSSFWRTIISWSKLPNSNVPFSCLTLLSKNTSITYFNVVSFQMRTHSWEAWVTRYLTKLSHLIHVESHTRKCFWILQWTGLCDCRENCYSLITK